MLQLKYNFFSTFCDKSKYELIEMDTDSLYMALSEENLTKSFDQKCNHSGTGWDRVIILQQTQAATFSHENVATGMRFLTREPQACSKKNLDAQKWLLCAQKFIAATMSNQIL